MEGLHIRLIILVYNLSKFSVTFEKLLRTRYENVLGNLSGNKFYKAGNKI